MATVVEHRIILTAELEREGRTARIVLAGEVDLAAREVLAAVAGRVHPSHDRVVVDLRGVTFVDLVGLDELHRVCDLLRATGCQAELEVGVEPAQTITLIDREGMLR